MRIAWHADGQQTGAERLLTENERRASSRAALLTVCVRENGAFVGNAIDVRCPIPHHAHRVGADLRHADIVAEDDEDIGLTSRRHGLCLRRLYRGC